MLILFTGKSRISCRFLHSPPRSGFDQRNSTHSETFFRLENRLKIEPFALT